MQFDSRKMLVFVLAAGLFLLACATTDLLTGKGARPAVTRTARSSKPTAPPKSQGTRDPNAAFEFLPATTPHCGAGDNNASVVSGLVLANNDAVVGQRVTASAGPGAEPISDEPAVTDDKGNYQVTFVCDGKACDGAFWLWLVDEDDKQISPFVEFIFENQCRRGTLNFRGR